MRRIRDRKRGRLPALLLCCLIIAWAVAPGSALAKLSFEARVGFEGHYKAGEWSPIFVTLRNLPESATSGERLNDFSGYLQLQIENSKGDSYIFRRDVELPANSIRQVTFYSKLPETQEQMTLSLRWPGGSAALQDQWYVGSGGLGQGGRVLDPATDKLVVIVEQDTDPVDLDLPVTNWMPFSRARIRAREIPDRWYGLRGVDAVVIGGFSDSMFTEQQFSALETWVRSGGRLVVLGGSASSSYQGTSLEDMLPVEILGTTQHTFSRAGSAARSFLITDVRKKIDARLLLERNTSSGIQIPVAWYHSYGLGEVHFWAFDSEFGGGDQPLLLAVLRQRPAEHFERAWEFDFKRRLTSDALLSDAGRQPPAWLILLLLAVYCFSVGPVNFRILYKKERMELAWLTIPAIVLAFSVLMYGIGVLTKGNTALQQDFHLILGELNRSDALQHTYSALFSPSTETHEVRAVEDVATMLPDSPSVEWLAPSQATLGGLLDRGLYEDNRRGGASSQPAGFSFGGQGQGGGVPPPADFGSELPQRFIVSENEPTLAIDNLVTRQWLWQVIESSGMIRLGGESGGVGGTVVLAGQPARLMGEIVNDTPYVLRDAQIRMAPTAQSVSDSSKQLFYSLGDIPPGGSVALDNIASESERKDPASRTAQRWEDRRARDDGSEADTTGSQRFADYSDDLIRLTEAVYSFPRGRAFLYARVERPAYQTVNFVGSGAVRSSHSLLVLHLPLQLGSDVSLGPGTLTTIPVSVSQQGNAVQPEMTSIQGPIQMQTSTIVLHVEAPFDPGTARLDEFNLVIETNRSNDQAYQLRLGGNYYDFRATQSRTFAIAEDPDRPTPYLNEVPGPSLMPGGTSVALVEVHGELRSPSSTLRGGSMLTIDQLRAGGRFRPFFAE